MSVQHGHAHEPHDGSRGGAATGGAHAAPGKQTQVERAAAAAAHAHGESQASHDEATASASASGAPGVDLKTLQDFIAKHEGYVDHVYLDSRGFPTAGIGHLLPAGRYHVGQKISASQITAWFQQDVAKAIAGARRDIGPAYDRLDDARKMVVIDMVFNLGEGGFGQFHQTIHAIQTGHFAQAASNMLQSLWARQVGHRATEDAAIMRSGHLSGGGGTGHSHDGPAADHGGSHGHGGGHGGGGSTAPTLASVREGHAVLKIGEHGPAVAKLQHLLHVSADGIFGDQTLHAVQKFQRAHHLDVDGIVGSHTLHALEHKPAKPDAGHGKGDGDGNGNGTGGVRAPDGHGGNHGTGNHGTGNHGGNHGGDHGHGEWSPAPSLAEVKSGQAILHVGEQGSAVKHVQHLLAVDADGKFGPATRAAVLELQHEHHMKRHDGKIDAHTLDILTKHPLGSVEGESRNGAAQRARMLAVARSASQGRRPDGRCYFHVCQFLIQCGGYGKITNPYNQFPAGALPEAHDFADLMNGGAAARFHIERLSVSNPYDAPSGSIVVVKAGSPGTHHPTAGDIAIADGHGQFYNGGMMSYSGRAGWEAAPHAKLLGAYIPK
jgi:peptidoglycan hydrolase-like protein with peptidoglycan-binding domain